ncbi:MAG: dependent oxidoreductase [Gemmatimonadetes bacterium]|nr:dependent oxidoreductase [Gemmatimonadota bacterium]
MSSTHFDVAVVGLGAMGSATLRQLAKRKVRCVGIDQYEPPHTLGSTHGRSRIIREAYYEHPLYVPFIQRAYELWDELERDSKRSLFSRTGGIMCGPEQGVLFQGALASARTHGLRHEVLTARDVRHRFPAYAPNDDHVALYEPRAGVLKPEAIVEANLDQAVFGGAKMLTNTLVRGWSSRRDGIEIRTSSGLVQCETLVLAMGPWLPAMIAELKLPLVVERQLSHWFEPLVDDDRYGPGKCPIGLFEDDAGHLFATFPDMGDGVKCGAHHDGAFVTPDTVNRVVGLVEQDEARKQLRSVMPGAAGKHRESRVCLYTDTPDAHFILDRHPGESRVLLASPCSGHGFKFSSAVGEVMADLATGRTPSVDISAFAVSRFARAV